jgi:hypothetical protein
MTTHFQRRASENSKMRKELKKLENLKNLSSTEQRTLTTMSFTSRRSSLSITANYCKLKKGIAKTLRRCRISKIWNGEKAGH